MASVASQFIEEVTAHAQSDSLEDARETCADGTCFPNNLWMFLTSREIKFPRSQFQVVTVTLLNLSLHWVPLCTAPTRRTKRAKPGNLLSNWLSLFTPLAWGLSFSLIRYSVWRRKASKDRINVVGKHEVRWPTWGFAMNAQCLLVRR